MLHDRFKTFFRIVQLRVTYVRFCTVPSFTNSSEWLVRHSLHIWCRHSRRKKNLLPIFSSKQISHSWSVLAKILISSSRLNLKITKVFI